VKLHADDFEVEEFESTRRSATVFAIDLSLSMAMRSNLVPAKKMVLALTSLIRSKFHAIRRRRRLRRDGPGTQDRRRPGSHHRLRLRHQSPARLALSRHLMRNERGERQIVVVTDGEPTPIYSPTVSPSSLGRRCAKPWKRPWPRSCAARRPVSRSTPSPSTSSEASSVRGTDRQGQRGRLFYTDVDDSAPTLWMTS